MGERRLISGSPALTRRGKVSEPLESVHRPKEATSGGPANVNSTDGALQSRLWPSISASYHRFSSQNYLYPTSHARPFHLILLLPPLAHGCWPDRVPKVRMTRYGGLGRTRPKKLTSKASIPVVREHEIDTINDDTQSALQQIETGVEKAEESVRHPCIMSRDRDAGTHENSVYGESRPQNASANAIFCRSSICRRP